MWPSIYWYFDGIKIINIMQTTNDTNRNIVSFLAYPCIYWSCDDALCPPLAIAHNLLSRLLGRSSQIFYDRDEIEGRRLVPETTKTSKGTHITKTFEQRITHILRRGEELNQGLGKGELV